MEALVIKYWMMCSSDDGNLFIWCRKSGNIVRCLRADDSIVNCVQLHPSTFLVATSGIECAVRLWSPRPEVTLPRRLFWIAPLSKYLGYLVCLLCHATFTDLHKYAWTQTEYKLCRPGIELKTTGFRSAWAINTIIRLSKLIRWWRSYLLVACLKFHFNSHDMKPTLMRSVMKIHNNSPELRLKSM